MYPVSQSKDAAALGALDSLHAAYKRQYMKLASNRTEFDLSLQLIASINANYTSGRLGWYAAINNFTDVPFATFASTTLMPPSAITVPSTRNWTAILSNYQPPAFDWRDVGKVTPVKDQ